MEKMFRLEIICCFILQRFACCSVSLLQFGFFFYLVLLFNLQISLDHHDATNGAHSTTAKGSEDATLSATEMQDQMDQFTYIMLQKFQLFP
jgi:hypothetical protein